MIVKQLTHSRFYLFFLASLIALGPLSIDVYMPILPDLVTAFHTDYAAVIFTISTYMFGMAFGQFIGGPVSDQIGRKKTGLIGLFLFASSSILINHVDTIQSVQILRIVQATGAGFATVICLAQIRDVFPPEQVSKNLANVILVMLIAPLIGPSLGTFISSFGWRAIFLFLSIYGVLVAIAYITIFPETHTRRPNKISLSTMISGYRSALTLRTNDQLLALRYALFGGFSAAVFFCYITNAALIFMEQFGLNKIQFSIVFAINGFMMIIGNRTVARLIRRLEIPLILRYSNLAQIYLLIIAVISTTLFAPSLVTIMIILTLLTSLSGVISPSASSYFISLHEHNLGSASSIYSTIFYLFGAISGGITAFLSDGTTLPVFITMLVFSLLAKTTIRNTD